MTIGISHSVPPGVAILKIINFNYTIMEHAVICNPYFNNEGYIAHFNYFEFEGYRIPCGVLDLENDYTQEIAPFQILIKTKAFSCNFRDRALLLAFNDACQNMDPPTFSPFGSDFVAEVIKVGKKVKTLRSGDRVISDGAYPHKEY